MKRRAIYAIFALAAAASFASRASAGVNVGDNPKLEFKALDGTAVSLEKLKGKIVVVDFWATWCGPCMAMAGEMVEMNNEYGPKGLQMIGVSLDQNRAALERVVKEQKFDWPQQFDGKGWDNAVWKEWGERGIPFTVLISPKGTVLWKGHPGNGLKQQIEKAFKEHPPQVVDEKTLARAKELLTDIEAKSAAGQAGAAMKLLAKVPEGAKADADTAARMEAARKGLESEAAKMLAEVDPLVAQGQYVQAINRLKDLNKALAGTPAGAQARKKLNELLARPEARQQAEAADKASRAEEVLAAAQELQKAKKDDEAYFKFKAVAREFPGTDAGATAAAQVKRYEGDKAFVKRVIEKEAQTKGKAALSMARSYKGAKKYDQARQKYQSIIDDFPGTTFAETAKQELASLGK
jgi:thiol-disulfide isomerase/thioredoxin